MTGGVNKLPVRNFFDATRPRAGPAASMVVPMDAPFTLEPAADGSAILTVPARGAAPSRLTLDQAALRELRDGIDSRSRVAQPAVRVRRTASRWATRR